MSPRALHNATGYLERFVDGRGPPDYEPPIPARVPKARIRYLPLIAAGALGFAVGLLGFSILNSITNPPGRYSEHRSGGDGSVGKAVPRLQPALSNSSWPLWSVRIADHGNLPAGEIASLQSPPAGAFIQARGE